MQLIIALGCGLVAFLSVTLLNQHLNRQRIQIVRRLDGLTAESAPKDVISAELSLPFSRRIVRPVLRHLTKRLLRLTPLKQSSLERQLLLAGQPGNLSPQEFTGVQILLILLLTSIGLLTAYAGKQSNLYLPFCFGLMGYVLPKLYLRQKIAARNGALEKELPEVLDLLTVCVEAGLGFDAALAKVVEKSSAHLAVEFKRVLQEIKMGKPRREALKDMARRLEVEDLSNFIGAVVQADQLGVSMGNMLRLQSQAIRQKRRQRVEEQAMKAPVKMLLPLVFFIFPCIFIVLLGPAVLQFITQMTVR